MPINARVSEYCIVMHCLSQFLHFMLCAGVPLDMTEAVDIHTVTGALKLYLRELPIPLISFEVFEQLLGTLEGRLLSYTEYICPISYIGIPSSVLRWCKCEAGANCLRLFQLPTSASPVTCKCSQVLNETLEQVCISLYLTIFANLHALLTCL